MFIHFIAEILIWGPQIPLEDIISTNCVQHLACSLKKCKFKTHRIKIRGCRHGVPWRQGSYLGDIFYTHMKQYILQTGKFENKTHNFSYLTIDINQN